MGTVPIVIAMAVTVLQGPYSHSRQQFRGSDIIPSVWQRDEPLAVTVQPDKLHLVLRAQSISLGATVVSV